MRMILLSCLLAAAPVGVQADSREACKKDFRRVCPDWPGATYAFCREELHDQFSEACQQEGAHSPEEAAWLRRVDNRDSHSPLIVVPSGAQNPLFMRGGLTDRAYFLYQAPFPAQDLTDRILKQWERRGYLPDLKRDTSWTLSLSKDRHTVARVRRVMMTNIKGQMAHLDIAYIKKFDWAVGDTQATTLDLGDELRVLEVVTPVRRTWDGKLPVFFGREIPVE